MKLQSCDSATGDFEPDNLTPDEHERLLLMSEHAIGTPLSPAAQAVLDAVREICPAPADEIAAAAIRELVNQTKKRKVLKTLGVPMAYSKEYCLAEDLLAIADELEGLDND